MKLLRLPTHHYTTLTASLYSPEMRARMDARERKRCEAQAGALAKMEARNKRQDAVAKAQAWRWLCEIERRWCESAQPELWKTAWEIDGGNWETWPLGYRAAACAVLINMFVRQAKERIVNSLPYYQCIPRIEAFLAILANLMASDINRGLKSKAGTAKGGHERWKNRPKRDYLTAYHDVMKHNPGLSDRSARRLVAEQFGVTAQAVYNQIRDKHPPRKKS